MCNYDRFKCEMYWILPKLAVFTPVPTSTQDVLAITLHCIAFYSHRCTNQVKMIINEQLEILSLTFGDGLRFKMLLCLALLC